MSGGRCSVNPNERTRQQVAGALGYVDPPYLEGTARLLRALKDDSYDWMQLEHGHRTWAVVQARTRSRWRSGSVAMGWWSG